MHMPGQDGPWGKTGRAVHSVIRRAMSYTNNKKSDFIATHTAAPTSANSKKTLV